MQAQEKWRQVSTAELVDVIARSALVGGETMLREAGMYPSPSVHFIHEEIAPPYLGYAACRQFYRGEDAARAISAMGVLPGVVGVTRLVVAWENDDLCTALEQPELAGGFATGFVVVDATRGGHVVRWHPYTPVAGPELAHAPGMVSVIPQWGREQRRPNAPLPEPVAALLATWRTARPTPDERDATAEAMEACGYRLRWTARA